MSSVDPYSWFSSLFSFLFARHPDWSTTCVTLALIYVAILWWWKQSTLDIEPVDDSNPYAPWHTEYPSTYASLQSQSPHNHAYTPADYVPQPVIPTKRYVRRLTYSHTTLRVYEQSTPTPITISDASLVVASLLDEEKCGFGDAYWKGKRVLELNSRTGLVSLIMASHGAHVIPTDDDISLIKYNIDQNQPDDDIHLTDGHAGFAHVDGSLDEWAGPSKPLPTPPTPPKLHITPYTLEMGQHMHSPLVWCLPELSLYHSSYLQALDVIIACDVLDRDIFDQLLNTLCAIATPTCDVFLCGTHPAQFDEAYMSLLSRHFTLTCLSHLFSHVSSSHIDSGFGLGLDADMIASKRVDEKIMSRMYCYRMRRRHDDFKPKDEIKQPAEIMTPPPFIAPVTTPAYISSMSEHSNMDLQAGSPSLSRTPSPSPSSTSSIASRAHSPTLSISSTSSCNNSPQLSPSPSPSPSPLFHEKHHDRVWESKQAPPSTEDLIILRSSS